MSDINLHPSWKQYLCEEFQKPYMQELKSFIRAELEAGKTIYPHGSEIFNALNTTPFPQVKVIIIGQDPYHGPNQAHGLSFSVKPGIKVPPSLRNIYKELESDLNIKPASHGYLKAWAERGILLLNNVLTVEAGKAGSHRNKGWEQFTDKIVDTLNEKKENLVFILWGKDAQNKGKQINRKKHLVLEAAHPSFFSAHKFFGNKHFSQTNDYLSQHGKQPIDWQLPSLEHYTQSSAEANL